MATITRRTKTYDTDGNPTVTVSTITCSVVEKSTGEGEALERLGLTRSDAKVLLLVTQGYTDDQLPRVGDEIEWPTGGPTYVMRSARHLRPDGVADIVGFYVVTR